MFAPLRRTSFWPPSMVYISVITTHMYYKLQSFICRTSVVSFHVLHLHLSFWLVGSPHACTPAFMYLNLIWSTSVVSKLSCCLKNNHPCLIWKLMTIMRSRLKNKRGHFPTRTAVPWIWKPLCYQWAMLTLLDIHVQFTSHLLHKAPMVYA